MSKWKQDLIDALDAGKQPTYAQLDAALSGSMTESESLRGILNDMSGWMAKLVTAHLHGAHGGLQQVMNEFIAQRVKIQVAGHVPPTTH